MEKCLPSQLIKYKGSHNMALSITDRKTATDPQGDVKPRRRRNLYGFHIKMLSVLGTAPGKDTAPFQLTAF